MSFSVSFASEYEPGTYPVSVSCEGGAGRASLSSSGVLYVESDGSMWAEVNWVKTNGNPGSTQFTYMIVDGGTYYPDYGQTFTVPVYALDTWIGVSALTEAMSEAHLVDYSMYISSSGVSIASEPEPEPEPEPVPTSEEPKPATNTQQSGQSSTNQSSKSESSNETKQESGSNTSSGNSSAQKSDDDEPEDEEQLDEDKSSDEEKTKEDEAKKEEKKEDSKSKDDKNKDEKNKDDKNKDDKSKENKSEENTDNNKSDDNKNADKKKDDSKKESANESGQTATGAVKTENETGNQAASTPVIIGGIALAAIAGIIIYLYKTGKLGGGSKE